MRITNADAGTQALLREIEHLTIIVNNLKEALAEHKQKIVTERQRVAELQQQIIQAGEQMSARDRELEGLRTSLSAAHSHSAEIKERHHQLESDLMTTRAAVEQLGIQLAREREVTNAATASSARIEQALAVMNNRPVPAIPAPVSYKMWIIDRDLNGRARSIELRPISKKDAS